MQQYFFLITSTVRGIWSMKDPTDRHAKLNARHTHAQFMSRYHHVVHLVSRSIHREKFNFYYIDRARGETMTQFSLFLYEEVRKRVHFWHASSNTSNKSRASRLPTESPIIFRSIYVHWHCDIYKCHHDNRARFG